MKREFPTYDLEVILNVLEIHQKLVMAAKVSLDWIPKEELILRTTILNIIHRAEAL